MSTLQTPFRYDFVGSFLRPQALKDAKAAFQAGKISKEELDKVINEGNLDEYKGLLEDAGVGGDMDTILKTPGLADSYNSIKSAYLALEDSGN